MNEEFFEAIRELKQDKQLDRDVVLGALEDSLVKACRKDFQIPKQFDVRVDIDLEEGNIKAFAENEVVRAVIVPDHQVDLETAQEFDEDAEYGGRVFIPLDTEQLSRTATQVMKQALHDAINRGEQRQQYEYFNEQLLDLVNGVIQRQEEKSVFIRLDKDVEALLPYREQVDGDDYRIGNRMKFLIVKVALEDRGLLVVVSRSHPVLIERLFQLHIPEVHDGLVEIIDVAREAGTRSKVAVKSNDPALDPIGTCVGPQGSRINSIVEEINGEKIDIIPYEENVIGFIKNALSPADVAKVNLLDDEETAQVVVPEDQLSLAIGKGGQNARLTAKLTGWAIDIYSQQEFAALQSEEALEVAASIFKDTGSEEQTDFELTKLEGVGPSTAENLREAGFDNPSAILKAGAEGLEEVEGVGPSTAESIYEETAGFVRDEVTADKEEEPVREAPESAEDVKKSIFQESEDESSTEERETDKLGDDVTQVFVHDDSDVESETVEVESEESNSESLDVFVDGETVEEDKEEEETEDSQESPEAEEIWKS